MVKLARPKENILDRIRLKKQRANRSTFSGGSQVGRATVRKAEGLDKDGFPKDKGQYCGSCNRSACLKPSAIWFNHGTRKYYCVNCAHELNYDVFNKREALEMYGHLLCTEGRYDPEWDYRYECLKADLIQQIGIDFFRPKIDSAKFLNFLKTHNAEKQGRQRTGQAFWNHFHITDIKDKDFVQSLHGRKLFQMDGKEAMDLIHELFDVN